MFRPSHLFTHIPLSDLEGWLTSGLMSAVDVFNWKGHIGFF